MLSSRTRTIGIAAAIATVIIWTGFIVIARAMALRSLSPWDIVACRIIGASIVALPWACTWSADAAGLDPRRRHGWASRRRLAT
jgi:threonine/homoserine efflux transporter RhtA